MPVPFSVACTGVRFFLFNVKLEIALALSEDVTKAVDVAEFDFGSSIWNDSSIFLMIFVLCMILGGSQGLLLSQLLTIDYLD